MNRFISAFAVVALAAAAAACSDDRTSAGVAGSSASAELSTDPGSTGMGTTDGTSPGTSPNPTVDPPPQLTTPPSGADAVPPSVLPPSNTAEPAAPLSTRPQARADFKLVTAEPAEVSYLGELAALNPDLASDEQRALDRASSTCQEIAAGKPAEIVIANTARRFDGAVPVDNELGRQIASIIERNLCPSGPS